MQTVLAFRGAPHVETTTTTTTMQGFEYTRNWMEYPPADVVGACNHILERLNDGSESLQTWLVQNVGGATAQQKCQYLERRSYLQDRWQCCSHWHSMISSQMILPNSMSLACENVLNIVGAHLWQLDGWLRTLDYLSQRYRENRHRIVDPKIAEELENASDHNCSLTIYYDMEREIDVYDGYFGQQQGPANGYGR